jgi:hypothetical protein
MTQSTLDHKVARATGESLATIRQRGFSLACPTVVLFDPEPPVGACGVESFENSDDRDDLGPNVIDWDDFDAQRPSYLPQRYRGAAA